MHFYSGPVMYFYSGLDTPSPVRFEWRKGHVVWGFALLLQIGAETYRLVGGERWI
jgi:hypothetical protein